VFANPGVRVSGVAYYVDEDHHLPHRCQHRGWGACASIYRDYD
jgi:hypothetical protein